MMSRELGSELRRRRKLHGDLGIAEMADRLAASERALSNYELGKRLPDIEFIARFAELTGTDIWELLQLRLAASGHQSAAARLEDSRAEYLVGQGSTDDCAAHARQALLEANNLDPAWSLTIMEMATRGEITPDGVDRLLQFVRDWVGGRDQGNGDNQ